MEGINFIFDTLTLLAIILSHRNQINWEAISLFMRVHACRFSLFFIFGWPHEYEESSKSFHTNYREPRVNAYYMYKMNKNQTILQSFNSKTHWIIQKIFNNILLVYLISFLNHDAYLINWSRFLFLFDKIKLININYKDNDKTTANSIRWAHLQEDPKLYIQILRPPGAGKLLQGLPRPQRGQQ